MQNQFLQAAKILKPHGIHGEVKIAVLMDDVTQIIDFDILFVEKAGSFSPVRILKSRVQGGFAYLQLEGVLDRNAAEKLRDTVLYIDRSKAEPLPDGRYYIADIIGCDIVTQDGDIIGTIKDVIQPGANDVFIVETKKEQILVPVLSKLIINWSIPENKIVVDKKILSEVCLIDN
ncbi:MAG: ribosome maturation factor RimM [Eubacteriales bacterium]|nr:ribosome maturation factor RimM [Eubacteriales bacterium]